MHDQPIFPDTWDIENKDPFLQNSGISNVSDKIFPKQTGFPQFPVTHDFLSLSTKDIGNKYYNNNIITEKKDGVTIYTDPEDPPIILNELIIDNDRFYKELDNLEIVLFASRNGARLLEQYQLVKVAPKEIALFLEIDDRTNYFGSVMRIEIGSDVEKMQSLPFREISQFVRSKKVDLSPKEVEDFIKNGITSRKNGILKFLMKIFSKTLQATNIIFDGLGTFFEKTIPEKLDFFRISDERWNGEKNLLFFPDSLIESLKNNENTKEHEKALDKAFTDFHKQIDGISTTAQECAALLKPFFPRLIYNKVKAVIDMITGQITDLKKYMKEHKAVFLDIFIVSIKMVNAMLCGFLNSFIDLVKAVFQIIGIIFKIIAEIFDFADNIGFYTEYIVEIIENFIGAIMSVDYASFFKELINAPAKLYKSISTFLKNGINLNVDWVNASYYYGYIVGLIIQTILEIIFTGGTVTAAKLAEYFKAPFVLLGKIMKASVSGAKTLLQRVLSFIDFIITKLKNPKQLLDDFIKFVEELLTGTKKEAGIPDNIQNLPESDLDWMASRKIGSFGGKISRDSYIRRIRGYLNERGITLIMEGDKRKFKRLFKPVSFKYEGVNYYFDDVDRYFQFMRDRRLVGQFDAEKMQMVLPYVKFDEKLVTVTEIVVFHEMQHVEHFRLLGPDAYNKLTKYHKEKYVWDQILKNRGRWTDKELNDALDYVNEYCETFGQPKIILK